MLAIEEEIIAGLGIHYRVVNIAAGDLGASAAKKYDIEAWLPGQGRYRELTSCSNSTDFQARRLDIASAGRGAQLVHTLNGTAVAVGRTISRSPRTTSGRTGRSRSLRCWTRSARPR